MQITDFLGLLGGLALFLYGMQMMGNSLEAAAGNQMKTILEKLTSNRFKGVLVGAGITAVIQSSSATTVMVVGFVSAGLMTLNQAVWVIMGANIGTTITGQLIALDISMMAPVITLVGVIMAVFLKKEKINHIGSIIAGLGILFIGMDMMSSAMKPLQDSETFVNMITKFDNPVIGILVGAVFTAIIQSSSASVGILQALAFSGIIGLPQAVYVLFGQNIGTCITAVLASIGTKINAKRATIIHLMFNIIGTIIFTVICMVTPFVSLMESLTPGDAVSQIANVHTTFNIVTTLILLPLGGLMAKAATRILPGEDENEEGEYKLMYLQPADSRKTHQMGQISVDLQNINNEMHRMFSMVEKNAELAFATVIEGKSEYLKTIRENEEYIDFLNKEICKFIGKVSAAEMPEGDAARLGECFKIVGNFERIADHAMNIAEYTNMLGGETELSSFAIEEIKEMRDVTIETLRGLREGYGADRQTLLTETACREQKIDDLSRQFRNNQIERMRRNKCSADAGILFSEMVTDFERIGDHALNIAQEYSRN